MINMFLTKNLRKYKAVPKEVQITTLRSTMQLVRKSKVVPNGELDSLLERSKDIL